MPSSRLPDARTDLPFGSLLSPGRYSYYRQLIYTSGVSDNRVPVPFRAMGPWEEIPRQVH